ncbi:MAG: PD40 domain-containing protein [Anaerolineales bacterium]|nr:PD40 domain-containing protein [Anaerolineales bacterium]
MTRKYWFWLSVAALAVFFLTLFVSGVISLYGRMTAPPPAPTGTLALFPTGGTPVPVPSEPAATIFPEWTATLTSTAIPTAVDIPGKIVFTCQLAGDQICLMNADGSNLRQLTFDNVRHWYPSLAPDGNSVVYSAYRVDNVYEIYEVTLNGTITQLSDGWGVLKAPEISPDGTQIVFGRGDANGGESIWVMDRDGGNPRQVYAPGWDPVWSPDGASILFASIDQYGAIQLFITDLEGRGVTQVSNLRGARGRNDWSPAGILATYAGQPGSREIFFMNVDGSDPREVTTGGDNVAPSFSPDGAWMTFMSYRDNPGDPLGCEIYVMRLLDALVVRLTYNGYCDWQPRWGP